MTLSEAAFFFLLTQHLAEKDRQIEELSQLIEVELAEHGAQLDALQEKLDARYNQPGYPYVPAV